jgi:hypothetical protein
MQLVARAPASCRRARSLRRPPEVDLHQQLLAAVLGHEEVAALGLARIAGRSKGGWRCAVVEAGGPLAVAEEGGAGRGRACVCASYRMSCVDGLSGDAVSRWFLSTGN